MKYVIFFATLLSLPAHAELTHPGYCSEFERRSACTGIAPPPNFDELCSCPGEQAPPPRPANGMRCSPPNHRTGDRLCCNFSNGATGDCWTQ